jgi:hypothetical protein
MWYIAQSLVAINDRALTLRWAENTEPDLAGYHVYMSINTPQHFVRMTNKPLRKPEWVSPLLRLDQKYYIYVTAVDVYMNESQNSVILEFQLPDAKPENIALSPVTVYVQQGEEHLDVIAQQNFVTGLYLATQTTGILLNPSEEMWITSVPKDFTTTFRL